MVKEGTLQLLQKKSSLHVHVVHPLPISTSIAAGHRTMTSTICPCPNTVHGWSSRLHRRAVPESSTLRRTPVQRFALSLKSCYVSQNFAENCRWCGLCSVVCTRQCALWTFVARCLGASAVVPESQNCPKPTGGPLPRFLQD